MRIALPSLSSTIFEGLISYIHVGLSFLVNSIWRIFDLNGPFYPVVLLDLLFLLKICCKVPQL